MNTTDNKTEQHQQHYWLKTAQSNHNFIIFKLKQNAREGKHLWSRYVSRHVLVRFDLDQAFDG